MWIDAAVTHGFPINVLLKGRDAVDQVLQHLLLAFRLS